MSMKVGNSLHVMYSENVTGKIQLVNHNVWLIVEFHNFQGQLKSLQITHS